MSTPKRIQRKRTKGWRMPEGAVYVGRPTKWGNPHPVDAETSAKDATELFRFWVNTIGTVGPADARRELGGHDLACWCPLDQPCHADVLLEIANPTYGMCTACGAVEVALGRATGTRDLSSIGESATYPTGHGCEVCW